MVAFEQAGLCFRSTALNVSTAAVWQSVFVAQPLQSHLLMLLLCEPAVSHCHLLSPPHTLSHADDLFFTDWSDMDIDVRMKYWDRKFKTLTSYPQVWWLTCVRLCEAEESLHTCEAATA